MASSQVEAALEKAVGKLEGLLSDGSKLTVTTKYIVVGEVAGAEQPSATTIISLDGDWEATVPVMKDANGNLVKHEFLYDCHRDNVTAASEYRSKVIGALVEALGKVV